MKLKLSMSKAQRLAQKGFTLLELLIVVAILAIIGGALIAAYDGMTRNAAQGAATNTIASLSQMTRNHAAVEKRLPNNLETLMMAGVTTATYEAATADSVASAVTAPELAPFIPTKLAGKLKAVELTKAEVANLVAAGITRLRYIDKGAVPATITSDAPYTFPFPAADGTTGPKVNGPLSSIDIPAHAYDAPRPGTANRGRGFALGLGDTHTTGTGASGVTLPVWAWNTTDLKANAYDNVKVGASPTAKLVALGVGNYSTLIRTENANNKYLASAPFYGNVQKQEYNHYVLLIDVSKSPARFVAAVDTLGDFLDEEFAEVTSQKQ